MRPFRVCCVAIVFMTVAGLVAGRAAAQTPGTGVVAGSVVARQSGQPVAGAVVAVDGTNLSAVASATGRFRIGNVPAGSVVLVITAGGFLDLRASAIQLRAGETADLNAELEVTPNFMERVQVTASKAPLSIGDVPAQTDIIDRTTMENRGDQTLTQSISHIPGAVVSTQLGVFESVMLRGMPRGDPEFTNTLLLIDGVPQATSRNGSRVIGLTINDASNIEVVRGPNSALYGRTAIGGSVNILTAGPTPKPEFNFDFTGGQQGLVKGLARVSGPISTWGGFYASIGKEQQTGYFLTKTGGDYVDGNTAVFGKLTFTTDPKGFGTISFNRVDSDNSTPTNEPIMEGKLLHIADPRFDRLTNFNIPGPNYHQDENRFTINYTRQVSVWARLVNVFGYRNVRHQFINDGDFIGEPYDLATQLVEMYPFDQELKEHIAYEELRAELTPKIGNVKNSLVVGGMYEHTGGTVASDFLYTDEENFGIPMNYLNPVIPPKSTWLHDPQPVRTYSLGVTGLFVQYMVEPTPRWVFTAGGRYDRMALQNQPAGGLKVDQTFDAFSPKASGMFRLLGERKCQQAGAQPVCRVLARLSPAARPEQPDAGHRRVEPATRRHPQHRGRSEGQPRQGPRLARSHLLRHDGRRRRAHPEPGAVLLSDQRRSTALQGGGNRHQCRRVAQGVGVPERVLLPKSIRRLRDSISGWRRGVDRQQAPHLARICRQLGTECPAGAGR